LEEDHVREADSEIGLRRLAPCDHLPHMVDDVLEATAHTNRIVGRGGRSVERDGNRTYPSPHEAFGHLAIEEHAVGEDVCRIRFATAGLSNGFQYIEEDSSGERLAAVNEGEVIPETEVVREGIENGGGHRPPRAALRALRSQCDAVLAAQIAAFGHREEES